MPRTLTLFTLSTALVVAVFAAVAVVSEWWVLPIALAVHLAGFAAVMLVVRNNLAQEDKPDPITDARIEEEGDGEGVEEVDVAQNGSRRERV